jgi:hypothetical protein
VNRLGVKDLGEIALIGMSPAIANAVFHATGSEFVSCRSGSKGRVDSANAHHRHSGPDCPPEVLALSADHLIWALVQIVQSDRLRWRAELAEVRSSSTIMMIGIVIACARGNRGTVTLGQRQSRNWNTPKSDA